jgi:hypothetical protein
VDTRVGLDDVEKGKYWTLPGLELRPLGRPAPSQSLSRLLISVLKYFESKLAYYRSRDSSVGMATRLRVGRPKNRDSILGRGIRFLSFP